MYTARPPLTFTALRCGVDGGYCIRLTLHDDRVESELDGEREVIMSKARSSTERGSNECDALTLRPSSASDRSATLCG